MILFSIFFICDHLLQSIYIALGLILYNIKDIQIALFPIICICLSMSVSV